MLPVLTKRSKCLWDAPFGFASGLERSFTPLIQRPEWSSGYPVDIYEDGGNLYLEAEVPGFKRNEIDLSFEDGTLTLTAERAEMDFKESTVHRHERHWNSYRRSFKLPMYVDSGCIEARLNDGVLRVVMPKKDEVKPSPIKIK